MTLDITAIRRRDRRGARIASPTAMRGRTPAYKNFPSNAARPLSRTKGNTDDEHHRTGDAGRPRLHHRLREYEHAPDGQGPRPRHAAHPGRRRLLREPV